MGSIIEKMVSTDALAYIGDAAEQAGNYTLARQSFERGAELGDITCIERLAYMFDVGHGVRTDKHLAMKLYRRAWRRGSAVAAFNIAVLYRERGNNRAMFQWFERAAHVGDDGAQIEMAKCYLNGKGIQKSEQAAIRSLAAAIRSDAISEGEREEALKIMRTLRPRAV